jgi:hypothetical protein
VRFYIRFSALCGFSFSFPHCADFEKFFANKFEIEVYCKFIEVGIQGSLGFWTLKFHEYP